MKRALKSMAVYDPDAIGVRVKKYYKWGNPAAQDRDVSLQITMSTHPEHKLTFVAIEHQNYNHSEFNQKAVRLGEFDISISHAVGKKDWEFYLDAKDNGIFNVNTAADAINLDETFENFHRVLAVRLQQKLQANGLVNTRNDNDETFEHNLLGLFLQYREIKNNPELIWDRLRL